MPDQTERPCRVLLDEHSKPVKDDDGNHIRILNNRHLRDCNTSGCPGCQPCTERHCQITRPNNHRCPHHVTVDGRGSDQTCASCLNQARTQLNSLVTMSTEMLGEAIIRGLNSEAFALAGPIADPEAWGYRRMSALANRIDPAWLEEQVDMHHPAWVAGTWYREMVEHLKLTNTSERPTLTEAAALLNLNLTALAHDEAFAFDELSADVHLCHDHLERVLHLDEHIALGPSCYLCGRRVVKDYGNDPAEPIKLHCKGCDNWWDPEDYADRVEDLRIQRATELAIGDLVIRTRLPAGTLRRWLYGYSWKRKDGTKVRVAALVEATGKTKTGANVYSVDAVIRLRDERASRAVS